MQVLTSHLRKGLQLTAQRSHQLPTAVRAFSVSGHSTIPTILDAQTAQFGHRDVTRDGQQKLRQTHNELKKHVDAYAIGLHELGWKSGDRLGMLMGNKLEQLVLFLACARVGITAVPLQHPLNQDQLGKHINHFELFGVVFDDPLDQTHYRNYLQGLIPELEDSVREFGDYAESLNFPSLKFLLSTGHYERPKGFHLLKHVPVYHADNDTGAKRIQERVVSSVTPDAPVLAFNSGSVDAPETSIVTQKELLEKAGSLASKLKLTHEDHVVCSLQPTAAPVAWAAAALASISESANFVMPSFYGDTEATVQALQVENARVFVASAEDVNDASAHDNFATATKQVTDVVSTGDVSVPGANVHQL